MSNNSIYATLGASIIFDYSEVILMFGGNMKPEISDDIKLLLPPVSKKIDIVTNKEYDALSLSIKSRRGE